MTATKAELAKRGAYVTRSICVYVCPTCKRRPSGVRRPSRCCGVPLVFVGSRTEVVSG